MYMTPDEIALEIYSGDLYLPTDVTTGNISYWLRTNIGSLNSLTNNSFAAISSGAGSITYADSNGSTVAMSEDEKVIFKKMYLVHYYDKQLRSNLGAAGTETVLEVSDAGTKVRRVNKTEVSKAWLQVRKDESTTLKDLVSAYKIAKAVPLQVTGDDVTEGVYNPFGIEPRTTT